MNFKYIDIHSHVNFKAFDEDRDDVIRRALDADVAVINVGTQIDTSRHAVEIANKYDGVYAIIGLHPIHTGASYHDTKELGEEGKAFTSRGEVFDYEEYKKLIVDPKVVGIGECGLDYYRCTPETIAKQKQAFIEQINLANEFNKPLMLHIRNGSTSASTELSRTSSPQVTSEPERNAYADALEILKEHAKVKGDVHFFAGSLEDAKGFVDFGFTLSFTGVITFTHDYDEVVKSTPLDMIMSETDSPYITPIPYRGKRNEPVYVIEVVKKIAEIKGLSVEEVANQIIINTKRVFGI
ncbi:TatD family hydrolase [Candidatus Nomurabacteria bacterium]|nr:TatD family hydrolase [Candidatus Nomurabacteria bacterium]